MTTTRIMVTMIMIIVINNIDNDNYNDHKSNYNDTAIRIIMMMIEIITMMISIR